MVVDVLKGVYAYIFISRQCVISNYFIIELYIKQKNSGYFYKSLALETFSEKYLRSADRQVSGLI